MERNHRRADLKEEYYSNSRILAWRVVYEQYDAKKNKWIEKKDVFCHLYCPEIKYQPLNLGECNDGSKFTSVNQAINQAKGIVDSVISYNKTNKTFPQK